jgi:(S)-3,5-dihydroxyphenylglycine transaminase
MLELSQASLHRALGDPVLGSIGFLNEVMSRYPAAISFAPGAPHLANLTGFDPSPYIDTYVAHLMDSRGISQTRARQMLVEYGPSRGLINGLVAQALKSDYSIDVPAEAVVITVGAQEAMLLTLRALFGSAGDLLAVASPCFGGIAGAARLLDIGMVPVNDTGQGLDFRQLEMTCRAARARGQRIRAVYVAPDFSNPAGTLLSHDGRLQLLDIAEREDFLLLEDATYGFTAVPGGELPALKTLDRHGRVIYLGTFAKICLPGARVGFAVADQVVRDPAGRRHILADDLALIKTVTTVNTSPLCQAVIGGMLLQHNGSLAALGAARAGIYRRNLALLLDALDRQLGGTGDLREAVTWNRPSGGFFVRLRLPAEANEELLEVSAADYGVLWTPMSLFYLDGSGHDEIRLSCSYLDPGEIAEGVSRLAAFINRLPV